MAASLRKPTQQTIPIRSPGPEGIEIGRQRGHNGLAGKGVVVRFLLFVLSLVICLGYGLESLAQDAPDPINEEDLVDGVTRATTPSGDGTDGDEGGCDCGTSDGAGHMGSLLLFGVGLTLLRRRRKSEYEHS